VSPMLSKQLDEEAIFQAARRIVASDARAEYLHMACGGDQELLDRVMILLQTFAKGESFRESPPPGIDAAVDFHAVSEGPGTVIGPLQAPPTNRRRWERRGGSTNRRREYNNSCCPAFVWSEQSSFGTTSFSV